VVEVAAAVADGANRPAEDHLLRDPYRHRPAASTAAAIIGCQAAVLVAMDPRPLDPEEVRQK
jgi:hypothetical protein